MSNTALRIMKNNFEQLFIIIKIKNPENRGFKNK